MTTCCNRLDVCYETCGTNKYDCDSEFRSCLHGICSDINKSLGFASKLQGGFKYLACPLFLAVYCGMVKTYEHQKHLTLITHPHSSLYFSVFSSQPVDRWPTLSTTQCGLLDADLTWTARGQHASARERRGMNCDTEHYALLNAFPDK